MTEARAAAGSRATSATLDHIARITSRIPLGTRARPVLGGDVLRALVPGLELAVRRRLGIREGTALELLTMLWLAGLVVLPGPPSRKSAGPAMARLAELTPLVQVIVRGRYRLYAGDPAFHPEWLANAITCSLMRDAPAPRTPADAGHFDASASSADLVSTPVLGSDLLKERERGETSSSPSSASVGDEHGPAPECPGAAASSSSAPAESAGACPGALPARAPLEPLVLSRSGWMSLVPFGSQIQRAAALACRYLDGNGAGGTATIVAGWLAGHERGQATSRTRASLARALRALIRRGLLIESDGRIRMPDLHEPQVLELFDIAPKPQVRQPSPAIVARLRSVGIDASDLGHDEAVQLHQRLWSRSKADMAPPPMLAAILREHARAALPVDLRKTGRIDRAAARRALEEAMTARMNREARERLDKQVASAYERAYGQHHPWR